MQSHSSFVVKHLQLIEEEHNEEITEKTKFREQFTTVELIRKGVCVNKLRIANLKTGLYGRYIIKFTSSTKQTQLVSNSFTVGDILGVYLNKDRQLVVSGVATSVNETSISLAVDGNCDSLSQDETSYCLIKLSNDITYRRLKSALTSLNNYPANARSSNLVAILFGKPISEPLSTPVLQELSFSNTQLNDSQREAVAFALQQKEIAIIHGPPGTGKTTTLVEYVVQEISRNLRVLVCAPSNVAVDNLVEKLINNNVKNIVRLGHPARALPSSQKVSLDAILAASDDYRLIDDIRREIDELRRTLSPSGRAEIKQLIKELKRREKKALSESLLKSKVIVSTLTTAAYDGVLKNLLKSNCPENQFDVVVIDECSQAIEASCWIVLTHAPKCVLAGDHKQLPPTIISEKAAKEGLAVTLMERLLEFHPPENIMRMLTVQYRMNEKIMKWSSHRFYEDKLTSHESNFNSSLADIVASVEVNPLLLIDTTGCCMYELEVEDEQSKGNEGEANIVALYVQSLVELGICADMIGVITPYNLQVDLIRTRLSEKYPSLEIKSVDGFQGREKEVIILSLVRSNDRREVGFLSEYRRINVAVTRAKRHVAVVCDSDTVSSDSTLNSLIEYLTSFGEVKSALEFEDRMKQFDCISRPENVKYKSTKTTKKREKGNKDEVKTSQNSSTISKQLDPQVELQRREKMKQKFLKLVSDFVIGPDERYVFPKNLSSFERLIVHEICEQYNLGHRSKGEDKERIIEIWKPVESNNQKLSVAPIEINSDSEAPAILADEENYKTTSFEQEEEISKKDANCVKKRKAKKMVKSISESEVKVKNLTEQLKTVGEDNIDDLIAAVKKMDSVCSFVNCKSKVSVLGQNCQFCSRRFCTSHSMSEIHGCGDAVRAFAKSVARKEGKLYPGTGVPSKKCDSIRHSQLQRLLNKKMDEMTDKRKSKRK